VRTPLRILLLVALMSAAGPIAWAEPDPPVPAPPPSGGRVALVLGGGAARGTAHVGVIRALTDAGVPIDLILGTSMGSLIGGLYAVGFDTATLTEVVVEVDPTSAAELLLPPRGGILDGRPLAILLDALVEGRRTDETVIPFHPVVIDLYTGEPQAAPAGSLADAIRASTAIPVLFDPVEIDGRYFYDGGLKQTIPTSLARSLGATYVIAVDVTRQIPFDPGSVQANLSRIVIGIVETFNIDELAATDVVLDPGLGDATYMDFDRSADFVRAGERVTRAALPRILADLEELGIELRPPGDPNLGRPVNAGWQGRLEVARRDVLMRPRPWNLRLDLGLGPAAGGERVTPAPASVGSRLRFGVDLRDGFLGRGHVGASYARSVAGGDAVQLRAGYRLDHAWTLLGRAEFELPPSRTGTQRWTTRWGVRWLATPQLTLEAAAQWPATTLGAAARWRADGLWLDGEATVGLTDGWTRGHIEAQTSIGLADPRWSAWTLHGRVLVGAAGPGAPASELFSIGPATGIRGTPPDAWTAPTLAVASLEVATRLVDDQALLEAALVTPSVWVFVDSAWFGDAGATRQVWAWGVGAGLEGRLFGFVPFTLGVDVGHGVTAGTWYLGWRLGPSHPPALRF
jgi:NTE family protein